MTVKGKIYKGDLWYAIRLIADEAPFGEAKDSISKDSAVATALGFRNKYSKKLGCFFLLPDFLPEYWEEGDDPRFNHRVPYEWPRVPAYTTSIDAAMELCQEVHGREWMLDELGRLAVSREDQFPRAMILSCLRKLLDEL